MTSLDAFLKTEDLDDLLRLRDEVSSLTPEESNRIASVIHDWSDRQAVANLLFHPDLIPESLRIDALDRALRSNDVPYFVLAATVGLQGVGLNKVPEDKRAAWLQALVRLVQSRSKVLAGRASVTLFEWTQSAVPQDILPELLLLYPVSDQGACRNVRAAVLARCGDLSPEELGQQLTDWRVPAATRTALQGVHQEYRELKARDEFRAMLMKVPALDYIPNLSDGMVDNLRSVDIESAGQLRRKPWRRLW